MSNCAYYSVAQYTFSPTHVWLVGGRGLAPRHPGYQYHISDTPCYNIHVKI